jgi:hypothetical protein
MSKGEPVDKELYERIKKKIYNEQPKHSLYRSARVQKEYQEAGGKYKGTSKKKGMNIPLWFDQQWISVNDYLRGGKIIACGNSDTQKKYNEYPLCRPLKTVKVLNEEQMRKMIKEKNELESKPLITKKVLKTDKFNIKATKSGR